VSNPVVIANLALSHLGDDATVSSIDPPEGSAQAEQAAQFYPVARDALIEMFPWNFALRRCSPAVLEEQPVSQWRYAYALPSNALQVFEVQGPDDTDDIVAGNYGPFAVINGSSDFEIETDVDGTRVLYTNTTDARIRYTVSVSDTTRFPPLFTTTLSYFLASWLAGPVLKGETGRTVAREMLVLMRTFIAEATKSDAKQRRANRFREQHTAPWMMNR